jgi:hypothetical protein
MYCPVVGLLKTATAIILLVVWLPATSSCLLERVSVIQKDECCPPKDSVPQDRSGSACCSLAAGNYKMDQSEVVVFAPDTLDTTLRGADLVARFPTKYFQSEVLLSKSSWQFLERAALPIRAPSFAS